MKTALKLLAAALLFSNLVFAQSPDIVVNRAMGNPKFKDAQAFVEKDHDRINRENIQLTEIASPPFKEEKRARVYLEMLRQHGLTNVEMDAEGNVLGIRKGVSDGPLIAIAAHLDTVFPEGTNVKVKQNGTRLAAPGIGDDTRGLAVLLGIIRAFDAAKIQTKRTAPPIRHGGGAAVMALDGPSIKPKGRGDEGKTLRRSSTGSTTHNHNTP